MNKIDSIIYFDDLEDMYRFEFKDMTASDHAKAAKRVKYEYWTREQLLELKEQYFSEFNTIRSEYVLLHTLKRRDLTPEQIQYINGIWRTSLDIGTKEINRILGLISECNDFYRTPNSKHRTFPMYFARHGISLNQTDIESILKELPSAVFCKAVCTTETKNWKKTFLKFEFYNLEHKFSNGRSLPVYAEYELPLVIYIVIAENLQTDKAVALVSFSCYEFDRLMLGWNSNKRVNLNYVEKNGSSYIVSVVSKPYSVEDPFSKFYISEAVYNKIIHLIEALTVKLQMKYPVHYKCDAYNTFVQYKSLDPINHGLPIPRDYFFYI